MGRVVRRVEDLRRAPDRAQPVDAQGMRAADRRNGGRVQRADARRDRGAGASGSWGRRKKRRAATEPVSPSTAHALMTHSRNSLEPAFGSGMRTGSDNLECHHRAPSRYVERPCTTALALRRCIAREAEPGSWRLFITTCDYKYPKMEASTDLRREGSKTTSSQGISLTFTALLISSDHVKTSTLDDSGSCNCDTTYSSG